MNEDAGSGVGPVGMAVSAVAGAGVGYAGLKAYNHYQGFQKTMGGSGTMGQYYDYVKNSLSDYNPSTKAAASAGAGAADNYVANSFSSMMEQVAAGNFPGASTAEGKAAMEAIQGAFGTAGKNLEGEAGETLARKVLEKMVRR